MKNSTRYGDREQKIFDLLKLSDKISIKDAAKILDTSESTVRRIFIKLENEGKVFRTIGGIQIVSTTDYDYHYNKLEFENIEEKIIIGRKAANYIKNGDIIFLDSGTTVARMCVELEKLFRNDETKIENLNIFTNSLVNFNILQNINTVKIHLLGGEFRANRKDFCGYLTEKAIEILHFNKCFLGTDGFNIKEGFTTTDFNTASIARLINDHSSESYVLADHSKYKKTTMIKYANMSEIDYLITDSSDNELVNECEKTGIKIII